MNKVVVLIGVVVVGAGVYFGGSAMGLFDGDPRLSDEELGVILSARADEINASGEFRYDDWSRLTSAEVDGLVLRIEGKTLLDAADLSEGYLQSRTDQAANLICSEDEARAISDGGATYILNWMSNDGEEIGTVTAAPGFCEAQGY